MRETATSSWVCKEAGDKSSIDPKLWSPFYYSKQRRDYLYNNQYSDFEYPGYLSLHRGRRVSYTNSAFPDITEKEYDLGCFGCSITKGHDLPLGTAWPNQYSKHTKESMANFAVGSAGVAAIYNNLSVALKNHVFKKIIILLPTLTREFYILKSDQYYFRIPVSWPQANHRFVWPFKFVKLMHNQNFFSKEEIASTLQLTRARILSGRTERKEKKVIRLMHRLLEKSGCEYYISSWDKDCYHEVEKIFQQDRILPIFDTKGFSVLADVPGADHPHQSLHTAWVKQILP